MRNISHLYTLIQRIEKKNEIISNNPNSMNEMISFITIVWNLAEYIKDSEEITGEMIDSLAYNIAHRILNYFELPIELGHTLSLSQILHVLFGFPSLKDTIKWKQPNYNVNRKIKNFIKNYKQIIS